MTLEELYTQLAQAEATANTAQNTVNDINAQIDAKIQEIKGAA